MRVLILTAVTALALPFMAFGQKDEEQQAQPQPQQGQEQTKEAESNAPAQEKAKAHPGKEQAEPKTGANVREHATTQENRAEDANRNEAKTRSNTRETNVKNENTSKTKVNVQEFKSRHADVFNLGVHPKTFFIQKYGENHVRLIGDMYFVYLDGCWVSVHVDGYGYSERVICSGDPDFVEVY